jgi:hypothetical protein
MIDREELSNIKNILSLTNQESDTTVLHKILTALKEDDSVAFIDAVYSASFKNVNITLLKNVYQVIKEYPHLKKDLLDSFSDNQLASKTALINAILTADILNKDTTVVIWGSWYGSILIPNLANRVKKIVCIDIDKHPLQIAKNRLFADYKNVDYISDDVFKTYRDVYLKTNLIINTSCEHMPPMKDWTWFQKGALSTDSQYNHKFGSPKLSDECYFAFQSNNMFGIEGHINCVNSIEEFEGQLPSRAEIHYREEVEDTRGTRYMLVGKFNKLV